MPIPLGLTVWEWGCPKRGDTHVTITPALLAGRAWGTKFQFSVGSKPHSYSYFRDGPHRLHKVWHKTYPLRDAPRSRSAQCNLAPSQKSRRHNPSFLWVNRRPIQYDFLGGPKSIWFFDLNFYHNNVVFLLLSFHAHNCKGCNRFWDSLLAYSHDFLLLFVPFYHEWKMFASGLYCAKHDRNKLDWNYVTISFEQSRTKHAHMVDRERKRNDSWIAWQGRLNITVVQVTFCLVKYYYKSLRYGGGRTLILSRR